MAARARGWVVSETEGTIVGGIDNALEILVKDRDYWKAKATRPSHEETQGSITQWADESFGLVTSRARAAVRANEEMAELLKAITSNEFGKAAEEIADVVICLSRLASVLGVDMQSAVDAKMSKNRARKWVPDGTGHGYHVKSPR
jgi:NTP pyrophosphatase (non-canonical NTP hydrolase)